MEQIILNMQINGKFLSPGSYKFVQIIDNFILLRRSSGFRSFSRLLHIDFLCWLNIFLLSFSGVGWKREFVGWNLSWHQMTIILIKKIEIEDHF